MEHPEPSLHLLRTIKRGWKIIAITTVLTIGAAGAVSELLPVRWDATAVLTVEPISAIPVTGGTSTALQVNMNTESVIAKSSEVLSRAAEELDGIEIAELKRGLQVAVPKGSQVLEFKYTADSAARAPQVANAIALAYNLQRIESAERVIDETSDSLIARIVDLESQRDDTTEGASDYQTLTLQISTLQERQASLTAATFYPGTLVSPATQPAYPSNFSLKTFLVAGLFLGLLIGFSLALAYDRYREFRREDSTLAQPIHISGEPEAPESTRKSVNRAI